MKGVRVVDGKMEHAFSIKMKPKKHVLFEGFRRARGTIHGRERSVDIRGANGILRIDFEDELRKMLFQNKEAE